MDIAVIPIVVEDMSDFLLPALVDGGASVSLSFGLASIDGVHIHSPSVGLVAIGGSAPMFNATISDEVFKILTESFNARVQSPPPVPPPPPSADPPSRRFLASSTRKPSSKSSNLASTFSHKSPAKRHPPPPAPPRER
jgi:hypothetical protein